MENGQVIVLGITLGSLLITLNDLLFVLLCLISKLVESDLLQG